MIIERKIHYYDYCIGGLQSDKELFHHKLKEDSYITLKVFM